METALAITIFLLAAVVAAVGIPTLYFVAVLLTIFYED